MGSNLPDRIVLLLPIYTYIHACMRARVPCVVVSFPCYYILQVCGKLRGQKCYSKKKEMNAVDRVSDRRKDPVVYYYI
jgi:hypothetical protein